MKLSLPAVAKNKAEKLHEEFLLEEGRFCRWLNDQICPAVTKDISFLDLSSPIRGRTPEIYSPFLPLY